ncbi:MAG: hypothetical protein QXZ23_11060 [Saccharolobus sp.]
MQINLKPKVVGLAQGGLVNPHILEENLKQVINKKDVNVKVDIGGEILKKQVEINLKGLLMQK